MNTNTDKRRSSLSLSAFKFRYDEERIECTLKEIIECYGVTYFLVLNQYYSNSHIICANAFSNILSDKPSHWFYREGNMRVYKSRGDLEGYLNVQIFHLVYRNDSACKDLEALDLLLSEINKDYRMVSFISKHIRKCKDYDIVARRIINNLTLPDSGNSLRILKLVVRELDKMTTEEFKIIQRKLFNETRKAIYRLPVDK